MSAFSHQVERIRLAAAGRRSRRVLPEHLPPVIVMTDPDRLGNPERLLDRLPSGWGLIYRHFGDPNRVAKAKHLRRITQSRHQILLISADPETAIACKADGVHWPESMLGEALRWRARFSIMTASCHGTRAVSPRHKHAAIDAVLVSAVFASNSPSAGPAITVPRFRQYAQRARRPVYGLGGINAETASRISDCAGLAGIEGFLGFEPNRP